MNLIVFTIKNYKMGFSIDYLEKIAENDKIIYPVPLMPDFIKGFLNFQGRIITAFDIASFYGIDDTDARNYLLISKKCQNLGYLVKNIEGFATVDKENLEDASKLDLDPEKAKYIKYMAKRDAGSPIYVINIEALEDFVKNPKNWGVIYEI